MALVLLQSGNYPIGQFDGLDAQVTSFLGGEVCTLTAVTWKGTDQAAADVDDGYVGTTSKTRPAVTFTLSSGNRPLFLADDGTANYGTLFGQVVGATVGKVTTGGTVLGPHTATGSGKITCWDKPGLYGVTLDAADTTSGTGLTADNATLAVGAALYATTSGKLTPNSGAAFEAVVVGRFVEFQTNGSLVNTPNYLVSALNSPTGTTAASLMNFTMAVFTFYPEL